MKRHLRGLAAASGLLAGMLAAGAAFAQKPSGILKMYSLDSPPSLSMLDGPNPIGQRTTMAVFNNLVMFDQHVKQNSLESIVPDLATGWSWNEEGTALTLPLRQGSNGMTASRSRPRTSSAPGTSCSKSRATSSA